MNVRRVLTALAVVGVLSALLLLVSGHSESKQWTIAPVPSEKRLVAWLEEKGFKPAPASRYVGPSQTWYEGPAAGTRHPIVVVLYKTPELRCDVLWSFEGHQVFLEEDRRKAQAFVLDLKTWCDSP